MFAASSGSGKNYYRVWKFLAFKGAVSGVRVLRFYEGFSGTVFGAGFWSRLRGFDSASCNLGFWGFGFRI